jgi:hypothetical protein
MLYKAIPAQSTNLSRQSNLIIDNPNTAMRPLIVILILSWAVLVTGAWRGERGEWGDCGSDTPVRPLGPPRPYHARETARKA